MMSPAETVFFRLCENIKVGTLHVQTPQGSRSTFGGGAPEAQIIIRDWKAIRLVMSRGNIGFGEAYVDGLWDTPDLQSLLELVLKNIHISQSLEAGNIFSRLYFLFRNTVLRRNSVRQARANIQAHYDVGNAFYSLWLDPTMTYSSAIYRNEDEPLEQAQLNKYDRLLDITHADRDRVLEIGCGWGGFAERAAHDGRNVTGITISPAQLKFAKNRLGRKAELKLCDYRDVTGQYDSIVSIEMIEAVGERYWPVYFQTLKDRLAPGGAAAIQAITIEDEFFEAYRAQSDYIREYIFPGGMLISPGEIARHARQAGLAVVDTYRFGLDYARTLLAWAARLAEAEPQIRAQGYDESFLRSWRYYLHICAASFANQLRTDVMQVKLCHA